MEDLRQAVKLAAEMHAAEYRKVVERALAEQTALASELQALARQMTSQLDGTLEAFRMSHAAALTEHTAALDEIAKAIAPRSDFLRSALLVTETAQSAALLRQHAEAMIASVQAQYRAAVAAWDVSQLAPALGWPWLERWTEKQRIRDAFAAADLVPSPSMETSLIDRVVAAHQDGASPEMLVTMVLQEYDANDCARIAAIVDLLCASPAFSERRAVLTQVLAAHRLRFDALTTYVLVPIIEGVLTTFIFEYVNQTAWPKHHQIARVLLDLPDWTVTSTEWAAYDLLIDFLQDRLYKGGDWKAENAETRKQYSQLNRHRLLHGLATQGTREHALRCFLVLDVIRVTLPAIRAFFEESDAPEGADPGSAALADAES